MSRSMSRGSSSRSSRSSHRRGSRRPRIYTYVHTHILQQTTSYSADQEHHSLSLILDQRPGISVELPTSGFKKRESDLRANDLVNACHLFWISLTHALFGVQLYR